MKVEETKLSGVRRITLDAFRDHRGAYVETYNEQEYKRHGIDVRFIQDDISVSKKNVLRGLHGDRKTWKLISCLRGTFFLVVIKGVPEAPDFGQWEAFTLSEEEPVQVLVPPGYANGHVVLTSVATFHYKQSTYYDPDSQFTLKWDDPRFQIPWPVEKPILSERDRLGHRPEEAPQGPGEAPKD